MHCIFAIDILKAGCYNNFRNFAGVAEQADARDLKSREVKLVPVRARSPAP